MRHGGNMKMIRKIFKSWVPRALAGLAALTLTGCPDVKPKTLGGNSKIDFGSLDSGTQSSFNFNFALKGTTTGAGSSASTIVYLQGAPNSQSGLVGTCNFAGTGCTCEFINAAGGISYSTTSSDISYESVGNYYRCTYKGDVTNLVKVRIKNIGGNVTSTDMDVAGAGTAPPITLGQLIGSGLDINHVRYIFRYSCQFNFLQKEGTTTQGF